MTAPSNDHAALAARHDLPLDAIAALADAIRRGSGRQAQFDHLALGGMGQWSRGGGVMIGDMFNHELKAKVERLCADLARDLDGDRAADAARNWWPRELGEPSSVGSQNGVAYAVFPQARRLVIRTAAGAESYDTGDHRIRGAAQHQGRDLQDMTFNSQHGMLRIDDLARVAADAAPPPPEAGRDRADVAPATGASGGGTGSDVLELIERLHDLQRRGILTAEEYAAKKAELLARL